MGRTNREPRRIAPTPAARTPRSLAHDIVTCVRDYPVPFWDTAAEALLVILLSSGIDAAVSKLQQLKSQRFELMQLPEQLEHLREPRIMLGVIAQAEYALTAYMEIEGRKFHRTCRLSLPKELIQ